MVIYETDQAYIMTTQHDHAHISGELASQWEESAFKNRRHKQDFVYAAREHDRGWIQLDAAPFWNDHVSAPYTFIDFPLNPRFVFYRLGIDEVEQGNTYAALLCSLMYKASRTDRASKRSGQADYACLSGSGGTASSEAQTGAGMWRNLRPSSADGCTENVVL